MSYARHNSDRWFPEDDIRLHIAIHKQRNLELSDNAPNSSTMENIIVWSHSEVNLELSDNDTLCFA